MFFPLGVTGIGAPSPPVYGVGTLRQFSTSSEKGQSMERAEELGVRVDVSLYVVRSGTWRWVVEAGVDEGAEVREVVRMGGMVGA